MYDDILGEEETPEEVTKDSIISALKANIEAKEEMINDLINRVTELERKIEEIELG
jgi:hypothetical protein